MNIDSDGQVNWYWVGGVDLLDEGRVTTVQAGHRAVCLTRTPAGYGAISNRCPHQGGPLGDGFLQNGYVVCPWHAWEYDPHTGASPPGYDDEAAEPFVVEIRDDGVYVGVAEPPHPPTLMDQMVEVMIDWGVNTVFGMVGHSNLGLKHAIVKRDVGHLIFPDEVQTLPAVANPKPRPKVGRVADPRITPPAAELDRAVAMIEAAERPGIIVGNGARPFADAIAALAEKLDAPVITTFKAKGLIADNHPLACGVLGRSGTPVASATMNRSDLLLVFGASFSNHTSITTKRPVIQVDFDRMMLGKFHEVSLPLWGEIGATIALLTERISPQSHPDRRDYVARLGQRWRAEKARRAATYGPRGRNYHVWQTSLVNPNFAQFADSCGSLGIRVEKAGELRAALEKALAHEGPSIVEVISSAGQL